MNSDLERLLELKEELNEETGYFPHYPYEKIEEEYKSLKSKIEQDLEKWDNFPSCNHSCDCTDCQIKCVRCIIQLKTGHFESDITQLRESNQELINNEEKLEQEIEQLKKENNRRFGGIKLLEETRKEINRLENIVLTQHKVFQVQEQKLERIKECIIDPNPYEVGRLCDELSEIIEDKA